MLEVPTQQAGSAMLKCQKRKPLIVSASSGGADEVIEIPTALLMAAEDEFPDIRTIESHLLFWFIVDGWPYGDGSQDDWRVVHSSRFAPVSKNPQTLKKVRKWLESNGFLRVSKYNHPTKGLVDYYKEGEISMSYSTCGHGDWVPYRLETKAYWEQFESYTAKDKLCQITRRNLGLLEEKKTEKTQYIDKTEEKNKKSRDAHSLFKLRWNLGRVNRGRNVIRLFSPWASASNYARKRFAFDGSPIRSIDLKASQPTLLANMAGDQDMLRDCHREDALYRGIGQLLGLDMATERDIAKKRYMAYAYGPNRGDWAGHRDIYRVQEWMREKYPIAGEFVHKHKTENNYRQLSRQLQDIEADIFVESIFRELSEKYIPALTVHDAIYFKEEDRGQIEEVTHKHLRKAIPSREYTLDDGE